MNDKIPAALASIKRYGIVNGGDNTQPRFVLVEDREGEVMKADEVLATLPPPALDEAYEAQWQMKHWACRAHELCNELRIKHPEIVELSDEGILHCAIHSILGIYTPHAAPIGNQTASPGAP